MNQAAETGDRGRFAFHEPERLVKLMNALFADQPDGKILVEAPVQFLLAICIRSAAPPALLFVKLRTRLDGAAHGPGRNKTLNIEKLWIGAVLQANLKIILRIFLNGLGDVPRVIDRVRQRRLAPDLFPGLD